MILISGISAQGDEPCSYMCRKCQQTRWGRELLDGIKMKECLKARSQRLCLVCVRRV